MGLESEIANCSLDAVAIKMGFFAKEGLAMEVKRVPAGSMAVASMLKDELDISESTIFSLASNSFVRKDFRVFATLAVSGNDNAVVAWKNKGIASVPDLKGKTVGVLAGGFPAYVLDLMLLKAGVAAKDVTIVEGDPQTIVDGFVAGKSDAVCCFGAWVDKALAAAGSRGVLLKDENLLRVTVALAAKSARLEKDPALFQRLLRAYVRAEEYVVANPDKAFAICVEFSGLDPVAAKSAWKPGLFKVRLDQSMVRDMEGMAQWQIDTGRQKATAIPETLSLFDFKPLEKIDAHRVTIIH